MVEPRETADASDWRRDATYGYTDALPRRGWAWEFLRRDPDYRRTWPSLGNMVRIENVRPNLTVLTPPAEARDMAHWSLIFRRLAG